MPTTIKYADLGTTVRVLSFDEDRVSDALKPEVYSVSFDPFSGFFLTKQKQKLSTPDRVYGSVQKKVEKILSTYEDSKSSIGILLTGDKGSGKTMTSSLVANRCIEDYGIPVILVEESFDGSGFVDFINQLGECVLFIDEFGKKFRDRDGGQEALLGMFDGTSSNKRLVLLTENLERNINSYILDRPGRVHYHFRHNKLDTEIIEEYCEDKNVPSDVVEKILFRRESSIEFSFDVLQAIVHEYNKFGGDVSDICKDLNIEQPINYSRSMLEVLEVKEIASGKIREVVRNEKVEFPHDDDHSGIALDCENEDYSNSWCYFGVRNVVKKEGDIYTFQTTDEENNEVLIKARRVSNNYRNLF